jgi:L-asparagine transporter-like permease
MPETKTKQAINQFRTQSLVLAALLLIADYLLKIYFPVLSPSSARVWLILFFVIVSNLVFYFQVKSHGSKGAKSVNVVLITTGFKLLLFLIIIVVYSLLFREDAVNFIIDFFILYLIFTIAELIRIRKFQKNTIEP